MGPVIFSSCRCINDAKKLLEGTLPMDWHPPRGSNTHSNCFFLSQKSGLSLTVWTIFVLKMKWLPFFFLKKSCMNQTYLFLRGKCSILLVTKFVIFKEPLNYAMYFDEDCALFSGSFTWSLTTLNVVLWKFISTISFLHRGQLKSVRYSDYFDKIFQFTKTMLQHFYRLVLCL